jgi:periplasmic divalent cation tolerance protein
MSGLPEAQGPALVWCPFPDVATASAVAGVLLDERLVSCVNVLPGMLSFYEWNGERGEAMEAGALLKTDAALLERAIARLGELHPYDAPAILGWRCDTALPATVAWLGSLLR